MLTPRAVRLSDKSAKRPDLVQMSVLKSDAAENPQKKTQQKNPKRVIAKASAGASGKSVTSPAAIHHRDANKMLVFTAGGANSVTDGETSARRGVKSYAGL